ncbi:MAG: hypothetical protein R3A48_19745 [Polyangiales bacterium]
MCQRVKCPQCLKPTYAGCGAHIEQVLGDVPKAQRCECRSAAKPSPGGASALPDWLRGGR